MVQVPTIRAVRRLLPAVLVVGAACGVDGQDPGSQGAADVAVDSRLDADPSDANDAATGDAATVDAADAPDGDTAPPLPFIDPSAALPPMPDTRTCALGAVDGSEVVVPRTLRATGCFVGDARLAPGPDLVPYDVNSPLWTDGAFKERYMVLPVGGRVRATGDGPWTFPVGAILVKTFGFEFVSEEGEGAAGALDARPVETRFLVRRQRGWDMLTYQWNDDATDGVLLEDRLTRVYEVGAERRPVPYDFPDREQCGYCHSDEADMVIALRTPQLAMDAVYTGGRADQLAVLEALGVFDEDAMPTPSRVFPDPMDETADLEDRARSYLAGNCAHCHQPGGWQPPPMTMDLRYDRSLSDTVLCGEPIQYESPNVGGAYRVAPGAPEDSNLYLRMVHDGVGRMPPLAAAVVDERATRVVRDWILSLDDCPE